MKPLMFNVLTVRSRVANGNLRRAGPTFAGALLALALTGGQAADIATWTKGNTPGNYNEPANWDLGVVPLNGGGNTYVIEIPANAQVSYDVTGTGQVDALRLGQDASFSLDGARTFAVQGISILNGPVTANGAGAVFQSDLATATVNGRAIFSATAGGHISVAAPTFELPADWRAHRQLFISDGAGSDLSLPSMKSLTTHGGHSGGWDYQVTASNGGNLDLSGLTTATGPRTDAFGNEDFLTFRVQSGGTLDLSSLIKISRRTRLIPSQDWTLPALEVAEMGWFQPEAGVTFDLPEFFRMEGGRIDVPDTTIINAPKLTAIRKTTIAVAPGGQLNAGLVSDISGSAITLEPGETLQLGTVSGIDRMSFVARTSPTFGFSASSYSLPDDWRGHRKLFHAEGAGVSVNLSSLNTVTVGGGHSGAWDYSVLAKDGATLNLSGLTEATGPRTDNYNNDDWLNFYFQSGGQIDLSSLTRINRKVAFKPDAGESFTLPALQEANDAWFNVPSGSTVGLPSLLRAIRGRFDVDFAGTVNATALTQLSGVSLNIQPGGTFNAPALTDVSRSSLPLGGGENFTAGPLSVIDAATIVLAGAAPLTFTATSYALPADYRAHRAIFHVNGAGAALNLSSVQTITTEGGHSGGWDYSVLAQNGGVIDLSGLTDAIGPRTDAFGNEDWLSFHLKTGGLMDLSSLATTSRRVRFTSEEDWTLPSLETANRAYFYPGAGTTMNLPALVTLGAGRIEVPAGAVVNAPSATAMRSAALVVAPGGRLNAPQVADLTWSALQINPGEELILGDVSRFDGLSLVAYATPAFTFSATSYTLSEDYRANRNLFIADGSGVHLALSSLQTVTVPGGHSRSWDYPFLARNDASMDLTGLTTAIGGRTDTYGADDWLSFRTEVGGSMELGDITLSRVARIQVVDSSAHTRARSITLRAPARLAVTDFGTLELTGALTFNNTAEAQVAVHAGVVKFTGASAQSLEVGGEDSGPSGWIAGNFGIGRLEVGAPGQPATLQLVDLVGNGNRGAGGEPEALYLYGVDTEGLILHSGSTLVLGDINVYVLHEGAMVHLNALLAGGDAMAFGDGVVGRFGGPAIVSMTPSDPVLPVVDHVDVTFNTPINPATFTTADVQISGPSGAIPVSSVTPLGGPDYRIAFPGQSDHGEITVRIGPDIEDTTGLLAGMDQNGNGHPGEGDDVFEGSFLVDIRGPAVVSAFVMRDSGLVGALFDEEVEPTSFADPASYAIGGVQPDPVVPRADGRSVELHFPPVTGDTFTIDTVGLEDLLGNQLTTPQHFEGTVLPLSSLQVGNPKGVRQAYTHDGTTFEVKAGGGTVWSNADHFQFYQEPRTGGFDVKLRLAAFSSPQHWARMGIMAREHSGSNSRHLLVTAYNPGRANIFAFHRRLTQGGGTDNWASDVGGVPMPNAWIRLYRSGNTFRAYTSTDGEDWTQRAETTFDLPETLLVGFYVTSEDWNLNNSATATIADWGDYSPSFVRHPQSQTVFQNQTARLLAEARGVGTVTYQWYFNGNPLPGATSPLLELANIQPAQAGDYHVVAQNRIGSVTSDTATVVVDTSDPGAGFEADLVTRNTGDGSLTVADWTMVGRMAVGLETPANASEFTRADCAPRGTLGNGAITIADWSQAGRYAAGLDPKTPAGGPNGISVLGDESGAGTPAVRVLSLSTLESTANRLRVAVNVRAMGNENSLGFSLRFDAAALSFESATVGADAAGAILFSNARSAAEGRLGVALALPAGGRLATGENQVAVIEFSRTAGGAAVLAFGGVPVALEAADEYARSLALAGAAEHFEVGVAGAGRWSVPEVADGNVTLRFTGEPGARIILETSTDLRSWSADGGVTVVPADGVAVFTRAVPADTGQVFYRARQAD